MSKTPATAGVLLANVESRVSINIFVKRKDAKKDALATVRYCDLYGRRTEKFDWLGNIKFSSIDWQEVLPQAPMYFFMPKDFGLQGEYDAGFAVNELCAVNTVGVVTAKDGVLIDSDSNRLLDKVAREYGITPDAERVQKYAFRVFDRQFIYYDAGLVARAREKVMSNFDGVNNLALIAKRGFPNDAPLGFVADSIPDFRQWSCSGMQGGDYVFPLYVLEENFGKIEKRPNFNAEIYDKIAAAVKREPSPEEVFDYIYAVLHTPEYRSKYKEFLKVDFPRIPYPKSAAVFDKLVVFGGELRNAHLLKDKHSQFEKVAAFAVDGENVVEGVRFEDGRVFINSTQYLDKVPEDSTLR